MLALSHPPSSQADFFALGGDSLSATKVVMAMRREGICNVRLVDLFNYPKLSDFVGFIKVNGIAHVEMKLPETESAMSYPLTSLQGAYLAGRSAEQVLGGVATHCYFEFSSSTVIDSARLKHAVDALTERHDALRSRIIWQNGEAYGQVSGNAYGILEVTDEVRALTETECPDPEHSYPLRRRLSADGKTLGIGMDNLMLDGVSMILVMRELGKLYRREPLPARPAVSYAQYRLSRPEIAVAEVDIMPCAPRLPWLTTFASVSDVTFDSCGSDLDAVSWQLVRKWPSRHGVTPPALLLGAYALEISELCSEYSFSINVTTFDRDPDVPGVETIVGDFTRLGLVSFDICPSTIPAERDQRLIAQAEVAHRGLLTLHEAPERVSTLRIAREFDLLPVD